MISDIPPEVMKAMAQIAMEKTTKMIAEKAFELADNLPSGMDGAEALRTFARAILETDAKVWPAHFSQFGGN